MPGEQYFSGETGSALYNLGQLQLERDRIARDANIASQGNMVRFTQGMQQMAAQRAAARQQAMQQAQANELAKQQLEQLGYFQRGQLENEAARIRALAEQSKAQEAATLAWRQAQLQPRIDSEAAVSAAERQKQAEIADAINNHAGLMAVRDEIQSNIKAMDEAMKGLVKIDKEPGELSRAAKTAMIPGVPGPAIAAYNYFTGRGDREKARNAQVSQLPYQANIDPIAPLADNTKVLDQQKLELQAKLAEINRVIAANDQAGLGQHVKNVNGKYVSTLPQITPFSGIGAPSRTQAITNGVPAILQSGTATNAPPAEGPMPAPMNPAQRQVGVVYQTPRGPLRWTAAGWLPP